MDRRKLSTANGQRFGRLGAVGIDKTHNGVFHRRIDND